MKKRHASAAAPLRPKRSWILGFFRWIWRGMLALLVLTTVAGWALFSWVRQMEAELPSVVDLHDLYRPPQVTRVLGRDGTVLAELFTERRTVIRVASLPAHVKLAILAAEDASFYEHEGINYMGIVRAALVNLQAGRTRQGGSTITQQVVKNLLLGSERTYRRKLREMLLARRLEQDLTKDEILELYLNQIYFGHGRYGIEEAAREYFGKSAKDLSIAEAALLAGLITSPETNSPRKDKKRAVARQRFVLTQMQHKGFLTEAQELAAREEPWTLASLQTPQWKLAPEAVEWARKVLYEQEPERAPLGGFIVWTSIDPELQQKARAAVRENLLTFDRRHGLAGALPDPESNRRTQEKVFEGRPRFAAHRVLMGEVMAADDTRGTLLIRVGEVFGTVKLSDFARYNPEHLPPTQFAPVGARMRVSLLAPVSEEGEETSEGGQGSPVPLRMETGPEGALVALDVRTREVLALVGNYEGLPGALDRAVQTRRQPGSAFKPIVYSYAIYSRRYTPATRIEVAPTTFEGGYTPHNYEGWVGQEPLPLREVIARSVNVAAVHVLQDLGPLQIVQWAQALGIRSLLRPDLSLALGSYEVTPLELCAAYATFASGGTVAPPRLVTKILDPQGKEVPLPQPPPPLAVMDEASAYVITSLLQSVVTEGSGARAQQLRRPVAGKTGTSNRSKDTWFAGYSPEIAAVTWVGYDDGRSLGRETGASAALPAWILFMQGAHAKRPITEFPRPAGVVSVRIHRETGKLLPPGDPQGRDELFVAGTEPTVDIPYPPPAEAEELP